MIPRHYYTIDLNKLVDILLPLFLQKPRLSAFLKACMVPVKRLYDEFHAFKAVQEYEAGITAQTGLIEKTLNDAFDPEQRCFEIVHGARGEGVVFYAAADMKAEGNSGEALYLNDDPPQDGIAMYLGSESNALDPEIDFRVLAPVLTQGTLMYFGDDGKIDSGPEMYLPEDEKDDSGSVMYLAGDNQQTAIASLVNKYKYASKRFDIQLR